MKHSDLQHLLGCIVGLEESYQPDKLQALVQLLQIETKLQSPTEKNVRFETCPEKEKREEEEQEVKQDVTSGELELAKTDSKEVSVEDTVRKVFQCERCQY